MASKAHSGNILNLNDRVQSNKFEDKTVRVGDVEIVFAGFISSRRGQEFNQSLARGEIVEAFELVMKSPDREQAQAFMDAVLDHIPHGDEESMQALYDHILGQGSKDSDPNS